MNERVKELRKHLGLSGEKFGEKLGVGKTAISRIENGSNGVTNQMLTSICREFGVSEKWLRTGELPMFAETSTFNLDDFVRNRGATEFELEIVKTYFELDPEIRKAVVSHFKKRLSEAEDDTESEKSSACDLIPDDPEELERMYPPIDIRRSKGTGSAVS